MEIGKGTYSKVLKIDKNGTNYAVKKFIGDRYNGVPFDMVREIAILKHIFSPYVIYPVDIDFINFQDVTLPFYDYNLSQFIKKHKLTDRLIRKIFFKISKGIYYLHSFGIIHRDIKPSNICVSYETHNLKVVLIDAGLSKKFDYDRNSGDRTPEACTLWYRPPELLCGYKEYSFEIDVWNTRVILGELYLGEHLFPYQSDVGVLNRQVEIIGIHSKPVFELPIYLKDMKYEPQLYDYFSKYGEDLFSCLSNMLRFDPFERYTIAEVLNSSYLSRFRHHSYVESKIEYEHNVENWKPIFHYNLKTNNINKHVNFAMRRKVCDWMIDVCNQYKLKDNTYFLACLFLDRFLITTKDYTNRKNFQLIGMGMLLISSKLENACPITLKELKFSSDDSYSIEEISEMEKTILRIFNFDLIFPTLYNCLTIYLNDETITKSMRKRILFLLYVSTLYPSYNKFSPSIITGVICFAVANKNIPTQELENQCEIKKCIKYFEKWIEDYKNNPVSSITEKFGKKVKFL